jgi:hypothetical protein
VALIVAPTHKSEMPDAFKSFMLIKRVTGMNGSRVQEMGVGGIVQKGNVK